MSTTDRCVKETIVYKYWDESNDSVDRRLNRAVNTMLEDGYRLVGYSSRTIAEGEWVRRYVLRFAKG